MTRPGIALRRAATAGRRLASLAAAAHRRVSLPGVAGALLVLGGLLLPWMGVPLESEVRATSLPVVAGPAPVVGAVSYGAAVLALLGVAVVGLALRRGGAGTVTCAAGVGIGATAILFVLYSGIGDAQLTARLTRQQIEMDAIAGHFGYPISRSGPTSLLLLPLTGTWRLVVDALRPGWLATLAGGVLLGLAGAGEARRWARAGRWRCGAALSVAATALLATLGPCFAANLLVDSGIAATATGDYSTAADRLSLAARLNPRVSVRPDVQLALGGAALAQGDRTSSLALLAQGQVQVDDHAEVAAAGVLRQAHDADPANTVTVDELAQVARDLIWSHADPRTMIQLLQQQYGDRPANHYAMGRYLYLHGDFDTAIQELDRVLQETAEPNVDSSALTYIALSEYREGKAADARTHVLEAVALDTEYDNDLARALATGLYTFGDV